MYTGTIIDDLVQTVARVEEHAAEQVSLQPASPPAETAHPARDYGYSNHERLQGVA